MTNIQNITPHVAKKILNDYLSLDAKGIFLSSKGWKQLEQLTNWQDAPGWDQIVIIYNYRAEYKTRDRESIFFKVTYNIQGVEKNGEFIFDPKQEIQQFELKKIGNYWKIVAPQLPPHIIKKSGKPMHK